MARGLFRKPSFWKTVGAFRSQWKRSLLRLFLPGYGKKGMGWWRNPKKAFYNWWYYRTSISLPRLLGYKPSRGACIAALFISCLLTPVDSVAVAHKALGIKKARKARMSGSGGSKKSSSHSSTDTRSNAYTSSSGTRDTTTSTTSRSTTTPKASTKSYASTSSSTHSSSSSVKSPKTAKPKTECQTTVKSVNYTYPEPKKEESAPTSYTYTPLFEHKPIEAKPVMQEEPKEPDENTPKSTPKHENDQYIRKRMIIAGSYYCDKAVLDTLEVGTYFNLEAEPDNPHDKDAVKLLYNGQKIGYIAKQDRLAFVTCLKLKRNIYGVITAIKEENGRTQYEYETWFDSNR